MLLLPVALPKRVLLLIIAASLFLVTGGVTLALPSIRPPQPTLRRTVWPSYRQIPALGHLSYVEQQSHLRVMMYNIHHGEGLDGRIDLNRIAAVIRDAKPDVILLTEVDTHFRRSEFQDQARILAQELGVPYAVASDTLIRRNPYDAGWFGTARYGIAMLSRYPVLNARATPLPVSEWQEPRVALTLDVQLENGTVVRVIGTHLGLSHDDRIAQIDTINSLVLDWEGPRLLMGDLNAEPESPELSRLTGLPDTVETGQNLTSPIWADPARLTAPPTFPANQPKKRIDFILVSPELAPNVTLYDSPATLASDHLPVLVEISF